MLQKFEIRIGCSYEVKEIYVHNFSHMKDLSDQKRQKPCWLQIFFVFFVFRPRPTTDVYDLDLLKPPVRQLMHKRAPDLDWLSTYSLFGPLCLGTGKTLKLSKLNNWPDWCAVKWLHPDLLFFQVQNLHSPNKIQLLVTSFNIIFEKEVDWHNCRVSYESYSHIDVYKDALDIFNRP